MDEYPPEFDGPDYCLVCGEDVSRAEIWGYIKQEKAIRMVDALRGKVPSHAKSAESVDENSS